MSSKATQNLSKIGSDEHSMFINAKIWFLQYLPSKKLTFAFLRSLKIEDISTSNRIKKYYAKYIQKSYPHGAQNLPKTALKLSKMGRTSLPHIGVKWLGCLKGTSFRFKDLKATQKDPKIGPKLVDSPLVS